MGRSVNLDEVRDRASHIIGLRPALIDTLGSDFGQEIARLRDRTRPAALLASELAHDAVTSVHGRHPDGAAYTLQQRPLREYLGPYLKHRESFGEGGAYSFIPIMVNRDRPDLPEFTNFFPPADRWHEYFLGSAPDLFPEDLLVQQAGAGASVLAAAPGTKVNTSLTLGIGVGRGQALHWHGGNVFVQVHGEKKWSLFSHPEIYDFFSPGQAYERRKPCPFAEPHAPLFDHLWWRGPEDMPRPTELITRPGDALYLPTGTWHATWNLSDYTFGYTKVIEV